MTTVTHPSQYYVDQALTNLVMGYGNHDYIANKIFPRVAVKQDTGIYYKWDDNAINITGLGDLVRHDRAPVSEIEFGITEETYACTQRAIATVLGDSMVKNADSMLSVRETTARNLINTMDLFKEDAAKDIAFASGTYASGLKVTLATNDRWSQVDHADSDPLEDIATAKEAMMKEIGMVSGGKLRLVIGPDGERYLRQHAALKGYVTNVSATGWNSMTLDLIAPMIGVDEIVVGHARYNTAKEGQTKSADFVWKTHAALLYVQESPVMNAPSFGYEFSPGHTPRTVEAFRPEGLKAEKIQVNEKYVHKVTFQQCGYFFENAFDTA